MYQIQQRDLDIIAFVKEFKVVNSDIIAKLFFSNSNNCITLANRRLKKLVELGKLNRSKRTNILEPYIYYIGSKPSNWKHSLLIAQSYCDICSKYSVIKYKREYEIKYLNKTLRCDLMTIVKDNNNIKAFIIEIQNAKHYKDKWTEYINKGYWRNKFGVLPRIIVYSRYNSYQSLIPIEFIKLD